MLAHVNPTLDELLHQLQELRQAVGKAEAVVSEARGIIEDVRALSRADIATTV
jgi:ABC-type transporter Mla subunit MlaD